MRSNHTNGSAARHSYSFLYFFIFLSSPFFYSPLIPTLVSITFPFALSVSLFDDVRDLSHFAHDLVRSIRCIHISWILLFGRRLLLFHLGSIFFVDSNITGKQIDFSFPAAPKSRFVCTFRCPSIESIDRTFKQTHTHTLAHSRLLLKTTITSLKSLQTDQSRVRDRFLMSIHKHFSNPPFVSFVRLGPTLDLTFTFQSSWANSCSMRLNLHHSLSALNLHGIDTRCVGPPLSAVNASFDFLNLLSSNHFSATGLLPDVTQSRTALLVHAGPVRCPLSARSPSSAPHFIFFISYSSLQLSFSA